MIVSPEKFLEAMRVKWREYGNVRSGPLQDAWRTICEVLNQQTLKPSRPRPVIPSELGSGKTTSAKMYCSRLPVEQHAGVLIVTRTIEQAQDYANDINAW